MFFEVNGLTSAGASRLNQEIRKQEAQGPSKGESIFAAQKPNSASTTSASNDTPPEAKKIAPEDPFYQVILDLGIIPEENLKIMNKENVIAIAKAYIAKENPNIPKENIQAWTGETTLSILNAIKNKKNQEAETSASTEPTQQDVVVSQSDNSSIKTGNETSKRNLRFGLNPSLQEASKHTPLNMFSQNYIDGLVSLSVLSGNSRLSAYKYTEMNKQRAEGFRPTLLQTLDQTTEEFPVSFGVSARAYTDGTVSSNVQGAFQLRTGSNSMLTGAVTNSNTLNFNEGSSNLLHGVATHQYRFGLNKDFLLQTSASITNLLNDNTNMTHVDASVQSSKTFVFGKNQNQALSIYAQGEVSHTSTEIDIAGNKINGNANLAKATLGARYNWKLLEVGVSGSAFNMSDTSGTQLGGNVALPMLGFGQSWGNVPRAGGWASTLIRYEGNLWNKDGVKVDGNVSYSDNGWVVNNVLYRPIAKATNFISNGVAEIDIMPWSEQSKEYALSGGLVARIDDKYTVAAQYTAQVTNGETNRDINISGSMPINNEHVNLHAGVEIGYNSQNGAYFGGGIKGSLSRNSHANKFTDDNKQRYELREQ
jgi:hypothetical protein